MAQTIRIRKDLDKANKRRSGKSEIPPEKGWIEKAIERVKSGFRGKKQDSEKSASE